MGRPARAGSRGATVNFEIARQLVGPVKLQGASLWTEYREVA
jgi:hypothetical protein